jgi:hypothetical protein
MKTVEEYMKDPRIVDDPEIAAASDMIKEIYAIRLRIQDQTAGMTPDQLEKYHRKRREEADAECARLGFKLNYVDLSGQGKLQPREREVVGK